MAPWCIHISCLERVARSGSGRDSVRGLVGAMDAELSRPDWLATVQSGRKQVQSRVCTPSFSPAPLATGTRGALQLVGGVWWVGTAGKASHNAIIARGITAGKIGRNSNQSNSREPHE